MSNPGSATEHNNSIAGENGVKSVVVEVKHGVYQEDTNKSKS